MKGRRAKIALAVSLCASAVSSAACAEVAARDAGLMGDAPIATAPAARAMLLASAADPTPAPASPTAPTGASTPAALAAPNPAPAARAPFRNPFNRDLALTLSLSFNRRILGELPVTLTRDSRVIIQTAPFVALITPLLNDDGVQNLKSAVEGHPTFEPDGLRAAGIDLQYDPAALAVVVLHIDPSVRKTQTLFDRPFENERPGQRPEAFTAYMTGNVGFTHSSSRGRWDDPSALLDGVVRYKHLVFETEFDGQDTIDAAGLTHYQVDRRYARLVFDQPDDFRRFMVGDLQPEIRGRQGYVLIGGAGVIRSRQDFNAFRPNILSGNRELLLNTDSTIRIMRNGQLVRQVQLDAGRYDLSNLPLQTGANNVQIEIRDATGRIQTVNYSGYVDPIDLEPGDYEYAAYVGKTAQFTVGSPHYTGDWAFTGYWRKAFVNRPALGVGLQASGQTQMMDAQTQIILRGGAKLSFDAAVSHDKAIGTGYAGSAIYEQTLDRFALLDGLTLRVEYISRNFSTLGNNTGNNTTAWQFSGALTRSFTPRWTARLEADYSVGRDGTGDGYSISAETDYQFNRKWSARLGVSYVRSPAGPSPFDGFGVNVAVVWTPDFSHRGEVRYDQRLNSEVAEFQKSSSNRVGSYGYDAVIEHSEGNATISGGANYVGNRFVASADVSSFGPDFRSVTNEQVVSLRLGSAIAFAGGRLAVGRPIYDSFAIFYPHENLRGARVIVGDDLQRGRYTASSGAFGPALDGFLQPYVNQSIFYDVPKAPVGYDLGDGVVRVRPTYKSGYSIKVGTTDYVSAVGVLDAYDHTPVKLMGGKVVAVGAPDVPEQPFFTNSAGRFAILSLRPGLKYRVQVYTQPLMYFEFDVPKDGAGLLRLNTVTLPPPPAQ